MLNGLAIAMMAGVAVAATSLVCSPDCDSDVHEALLGSVKTNEFFDDIFEQRHRHTSGGAVAQRLFDGFDLNDFVHVIDASLTRSIVAQMRRDPKLPQVREMMGASGVLDYEQDIAVSFPGGNTNEKMLELRKDFDAAHAAKRRPGGAIHLELSRKHGYTVIIRDADGRHPTLARVARRVEALLGLQVGVSLYFTPADTDGVVAHIDDMDVIAVQLVGAKRWSLQRSTVMCPHDRVAKLASRHYNVTEPVHEAALGVGDVLYVPRGMIHNASTKQTGTTRGSVHASIGVEVLPRKMLVSLAFHVISALGSDHARTKLAASCFSAKSAVSLLVAQMALRDWQWRRAVVKPAAIDTCSPAGAVVLATLRGRLVDAVSAALATLEAAPRRRKAIEALFSQEHLLQHLDVWFDVARCNVATETVAATVADGAATDTEGVFRRTLQDAENFLRRLEALSDSDLCVIVEEYVRDANAEDQRSRAGEDVWLRANTMLLEAKPRPTKHGSDEL